MISCSEYDYIELVCMYRYPVILTMKSGEICKGVALDTQRNDLKQECIKIKGIDDDVCLVILDDISRLDVSVENPHFKEITFG